MIKLIVEKINARIEEFTYLDFCIYSYSHDVLTIAASTNFSYHHDFEIRFKGVFTISCNSSWSSNTKKKVFEVLNNTSEGDFINLKYKVEIGHSVFKINTEEEDNFYIVAEGIELNDNVVKYYE